MGKLYTVAVSGSQAFFASGWLVLLVLIGRVLCEIGIIQDPLGAANQHEPYFAPTLSACRKSLPFEDSRRMVFPVPVMPHRVHSRFGRLFSRFEELLSLRWSLHVGASVLLAVEAGIVYRSKD
jgi:hypothetical protein